MKTLATALLAIGLLTAALPVAFVQAQAPPVAPAPIGFGMDAASMNAQTAAGVKPDYATFWIGPWTLKSGWGGPDSQLAAMRSAGVTPAIHFYYWGDDISQSCIENGCWSSLHGAQKDKAGWQTLAQQMVDHLNAKMGGEPVVVFLETEFNKGGVHAYEPLDGYLAEKAAFIHENYPAAKVVMALGNWGSAYWGTWDRTAAASDMVGIQGMRGSTRQSLSDYGTLYEGLKAGTATLKAKFAKPIFLQDIALSSYPEPDWVQPQADTLREVFDHMDDLKADGVQAMVYRSWLDSPTMDTANYYGVAERYWGLASTKAWKPSAQVWIDGVKAERTPANQAPTAAFAASADGLSVSVDAAASRDPEGQPLSFSWAFGDGASATGPTATHAYAAPGTYTVTLTASDGRAASTANQAVTVTRPNQAPTAAFTASASGLAVSVDASSSSDPEGAPLSYAWSFGDGASATGRTASHTYAAGGTYTVRLTVSDGSLAGDRSQAVTATAPPAPYTATITVASGSNEWWQEVKVTSSPKPAKVEFSANGGPWKAMALKSWGNWAVSTYVAKGTPVVFRATAADGQTSVSASQPWLGAAPAAHPAPPPALSASFTPRSVGNDWWVEVKVTSGQTVSKVEASLNGGAWTQLPGTSWGTHAKSLNAPNGTKVVFRATSTTGATATSSPVTWT